MVTKNKAAPQGSTQIAAMQKKRACQLMPPFPIIGIGASAGGLEAFESFFEAISQDFGAAFVLVTHLDPNHASILPELIQKKTSMQVNLVSDNMAVVPNQVFVIPPNTEMAILKGILLLQERPISPKAPLPIDVFFRSLAQDKKDKAVGIILSGTGTDGTLGVRTIKGEGGMVMVQDMESAKYDGMPASAISTGLVDYILPPDKMPAQLFSFLSHQSEKRLTTTGFDDATIQIALPKIICLLRDSTGQDFALYKKSNIYRRIERRMHVQLIDNIDDYIRYLRESEHELSILFKDLLIGVTSFFRDPEAFLLLKENVLDLLKNKPDDYLARVWVPGCCSGEEAYSIAIVFHECMETLGRRFPVQIFGTDLDEAAINMARTGVYPESISADISLDRLKRFFTRDENHFQIKHKIRKMVVFAVHNMINEPPFTKLDLLSCRNLLIYFETELQIKLQPLFHYSLKNDGILFLGPSESLDLSSDLFRAIDKKWMIFKHHSPARPIPQRLDLPTASPAGQIPDKGPLEAVTPLKMINPLKLMKSIISQGDMSTCLVIDDHGSIIYIHGRTGCYLEPAEGEASLNIIEMARPGLKEGIANAIMKMATERQEVLVKGLQVENNGGQIEVDLIFRPLPDVQIGHRGLMMVIFDEVSHRNAENKSAHPATRRQASKSAEVIAIENELYYTKENLHATIEEMQTSKEELQSLNEETSTLNSELQRKIDELVSTQNDMKNLLDATNIATIFVDIEMNIRGFTPKLTELIPLSQIDIGRPISHFSTNLQEVDLVKSAQEVLRKLCVLEIEVQEKNRNVYRMRLSPYRTVNDDIDGVVITFEDITQLKQLSQEKRLAIIVKDSNDAILLYGFDGKILAWNKGATNMYGYTEAEALKMNVLDIIPPEDIDKTKKLFIKLKNENIKSAVTKRLKKDGHIVSAWLTISKVKIEENQSLLIATTERDLSLLNKEGIEEMPGG